MAMGGTATTGITANTILRMVFDAGALYRDWGEVGEELVGVTRGGSTFNVTREDREAEFDGKRGPVKGLRRTVGHTAMLETTLVEMSLNTFLELTRGTAVSDGEHYTITPTNIIADSDYLTNVALVALSSATAGLPAGKPTVLKLLNALSIDEWAISVDDINEGELTTKWAAHYDSVIGFTTPPFEVLVPVAAS